MPKKLILAATLFLAACATPEPEAQLSIIFRRDQCLPIQSMAPALFQTGREVLIATSTIRLTGNFHVVTMHFASQNGAWTIVTVAPNGIACMVLWGLDFEIREPKPSTKAERIGGDVYSNLNGNRIF